MVRERLASLVVGRRLAAPHRAWGRRGGGNSAHAPQCEGKVQVKRCAGHCPLLSCCERKTQDVRSLRATPTALHFRSSKHRLRAFDQLQHVLLQRCDVQGGLPALLRRVAGGRCARPWRGRGVGVAWATTPEGRGPLSGESGRKAAPCEKAEAACRERGQGRMSSLYTATQATAATPLELTQPDAVQTTVAWATPVQHRQARIHLGVRRCLRANYGQPQRAGGKRTARQLGSTGGLPSMLQPSAHARVARREPAHGKRQPSAQWRRSPL